MLRENDTLLLGTSAGGNVHGLHRMQHKCMLHSAAARVSTSPSHQDAYLFKVMRKPLGNLAHQLNEYTLHYEIAADANR
jgi:hypothetical protein